MRSNFFIILSLGVLLTTSTYAQQVVQVGKGSYASYTPLAKCKSNEHGGDQSRYMQYRKLYINEQPGQPIPTNDWWTDMIKETQPYSGHLWSYPQYVEANATGVSIAWPDYWIQNGTEMKPTTKLNITGTDFHPAEAIAQTWHDWDMSFSMSDGGKQMF
ncbi:MAG: hypothetical protein IJ680_01700, partial [Paludibacteraceae bacterium]|nr:hypothetical protein [Paludibacteraceae bacterium]